MNFIIYNLIVVILIERISLLFDCHYFDVEEVRFDHGWYEMYEMTNCHDLVQDYYFEVVEFRLDNWMKHYLNVLLQE